LLRASADKEISLSGTDCDVAIVGAGPYGLQMSQGMLLRSPYIASNIADPERTLTLDGYRADTHPAAVTARRHAHPTTSSR
jgi:hypothetical protein